MFLLLALIACNNPCQQICVEMAKYADECGYTVDKAEISACQDRYVSSALDEATLAQCQDRSDPAALREWWTCENLAENYGNAVK